MRRFQLKFAYPLQVAWLIISLFAACFVFISCEKEGDQFPDEVIFRFSVVDDLGNTISGAKVSFYDDENAYLNGLNNNDISGAVDTLVTTGFLDSVALEGGKEHWVLVQYFDISRSLLLSNAGISDQIDELQKSSELFATLYIGPQGGNVSFFSLASNHFPIRVTLGPLSDTILVSSAAAPTSPGSTLSANFNLPSNTYPYYAVSDNGCVWTGQVSVNNGGFYPIELNSCIRGRITFVAPTYNPIHGPISVTLDNNDFLGVLNGVGTYSCASVNSSAPGTGGGDFITVTRDQNNYTYIAKSQDNACVWTGSFSIVSETCIVISLPTCP